LKDLSPVTNELWISLQAAPNIVSQSQCDFLSCLTVIGHRDLQCRGDWARSHISDSNATPFPNFFESGSGSDIFQIWESKSCSNSGNHRFNRI